MQDHAVTMFSDEAARDDLLFRRMKPGEQAQTGAHGLAVILGEKDYRFAGVKAWEIIRRDELAGDGFLVDTGRHVQQAAFWDLLSYRVSTAPGRSFRLSIVCRMAFRAVYIRGLERHMRLKEAMTAKDVIDALRPEITAALAREVGGVFEGGEPYYNQILTRREEIRELARHCLFGILLDHGLLLENNTFAIERYARPFVAEAGSA